MGIIIDYNSIAYFFGFVNIFCTYFFKKAPKNTVELALLVDFFVKNEKNSKNLLTNLDFYAKILNCIIIALVWKLVRQMTVSMLVEMVILCNLTDLLAV